MRATLVGIAAIFVSAFAASSASAYPCDTGSASFEFTGTERCYEVEPGVNALDVVAVGAPGGLGGSTYTGVAGLGANGARVSARISVSPGQLIFVTVGGAGAPGAYAGGGAAGGFNGGAAGGRASMSGNPGGGGGGGASDLRSCAAAAPVCPEGSSLLSRLLVAAGGGGGGAAQGFGSGGDGGGGGALGADGLDAPPIAGGLPGHGGKGGRADAGGDPGAPGPGCGLASPNASAGQLGLGGKGGYQASGGGGGGGGLYGGGGGGGGCGGTFAGSGGAGGGSSFGPVGAAFELDSSGVASVAITPVLDPPPDDDPPAETPPTTDSIPPAALPADSAAPGVGDLRVAGRALVNGRGRALIAVRCSGPQDAGCAGRIQLKMTSGEAPRRWAAAGSASYDLPAGEGRRLVPVALTAKALERLRSASNQRLAVKLSAPGLSRGVVLALP
jgi:hypothetical protein